jgi:hypothetical protein
VLGLTAFFKGGDVKNLLRRMECWIVGRHCYVYRHSYFLAGGAGVRPYGVCVHCGKRI